MSSFYSEQELAELGIASYGKNVLISRKASLYSPEKMNIGDNVRIDDFCVLSGKITLGNFIHIAAFCALYGGEGGITFDDYSTISSRCAVYALTDDYSGEFMTNPMIPEKYLGTVQSPVYIGKHCIVGTGSTVLPGVRIEEGCSVGAMSLINAGTEAWGIYAGVPAKRIKERSRNLLELCKKFEEER